MSPRSRDDRTSARTRRLSAVCRHVVDVEFDQLAELDEWETAARGRDGFATAQPEFGARAECLEPASGASRDATVLRAAGCAARHVPHIGDAQTGH